MGMRGSASLPRSRLRTVILLFIALVLARFGYAEKLTVMFFLTRSSLRKATARQDAERGNGDGTNA